MFHAGQPPRRKSLGFLQLANYDACCHAKMASRRQYPLGHRVSLQVVQCLRRYQKLLSKLISLVFFHRTRLKRRIATIDVNVLFSMQNDVGGFMEECEPEMIFREMAEA